MKKIVLVLGLVAGMVANAQMAIISGANQKVYRVIRLNFDSVEVKHMEMGNVKSTDTMTVGDFITLTGGYSIMSGNITNPKPVAPKIDEHKHEHKPILTNEQKFTAVVYGGTALLVYAIYKLVMWDGNTTSHSNPPSYGGGQCLAIAASTGLRCKHSASYGSAYCWQHQ